MPNPHHAYREARHRVRQWGRTVLLALLMLGVLAGCAGVQFVSSYDPAIETGVSRYAEDLQTFVAKMSFLYGTKDGSYEKNQDFYATQTGRLGALILRAEANDPGKGCTLSDKAAQWMGARLPDALKSVAKDTAGDGDGCTVIMLKNLKEQLGLLAKLHKTMKGLNEAAAVSVLNITDQAIRAVLMVEAVKKKGLET